MVDENIRRRSYGLANYSRGFPGLNYEAIHTNRDFACHPHRGVRRTHLAVLPQKSDAGASVKISASRRCYRSRDPVPSSSRCPAAVPNPNSNCLGVPDENCSPDRWSVIQ